MVKNTGNKKDIVLRHNLKGKVIWMFGQEDNTYNEIREKSLFRWLEEMENHEDVAVRGGVKLCREYIKHLTAQTEQLKAQNELKNQYLRKMSNKEIK